MPPGYGGSKTFYGQLNFGLKRPKKRKKIKFSKKPPVSWIYNVGGDKYHGKSYRFRDSSRRVSTLNRHLAYSQNLVPTADHLGQIWSNFKLISRSCCQFSQITLSFGLTFPKKWTEKLERFSRSEFSLHDDRRKSGSFLCFTSQSSYELEINKKIFLSINIVKLGYYLGFYTRINPFNYQFVHILTISMRKLCDFSCYLVKICPSNLLKTFFS